MIYYILAALVLSLARQRTRSALNAALVFVGVIALHMAITPLIYAHTPPQAAGYAYHGSMLFLYAVAFFVMNHQRLSLMGLYLQIIAVAGFASELFGWSMWTAGQAPETYNNTALVLLSVAAFILFTGGPHVWRNTYANIVYHYLSVHPSGYGNQSLARVRKEASE